LTLIDSSTPQLVRLPCTRTPLSPPSLSAPTPLRACRSSPRCACTLSWVCWGGRAGVSEAMHRIAASMMDGSRCGRGEFAAGDSQRSRRRGYGAARPRQEMPNFRGSFAENLASCSRRARVCPRERRSTHRLATYRCWSSAWYRDACVRVFLVNAPVRFGRSVGTHLFTLSELPSLRSLTTWPGQGSWWVPTCRSSAGGGCRVGEALLQLAEHGRRQLEHQRQAVCVAHQRIQRVQTRVPPARTCV
jgi:hypothetical protein